MDAPIAFDGFVVMDISSQSQSTQKVDFEEFLILEVEKCPWLWDIKCNEYRDVMKRHNSWEEIARKLGNTGYECQKEWKKIRDKFTRELREKETKNGSYWKHMKTMSFLRPSIKHRTKPTENLGSPAEDLNIYESSQLSVPENHLDENDISLNDEQDDVIYSNPIEIHSGSPKSISNASSAGRAPRKRKHDKINEEIMATLRSATETLNSLKNKRMEQNLDVPSNARGLDSDLLFCQSLCGPLKALSPRKKALAKVRLQQALFDVEYNN